MEKKDESLFDIRVVERNIRRGLITKEEYEQYLESVEDCIDIAAAVEATFSSSDQVDEIEAE